MLANLTRSPARTAGLFSNTEESVGRPARGRSPRACLEIEMELIEYRVRPVMRYVVTRYEEDITGPAKCSVSTAGEFDNAESAHAVAYALCKAEHERLGWPPGDERMQYPRSVDGGTDVECRPAHFAVPA